MASSQTTSTSHGQRVLRNAPRSTAYTVTQTTNIPSRPAPQQAVLRLRGTSVQSVTPEEHGEESKSRQRIHWAEDVVDNEGLGRKKSKVCCIYHAPKGIDESSDESSSDSDDSDSADDGTARPTRGGKKSCKGHEHDGDGHNHNHNESHGLRKKIERKGSPNAYERLPKPRRGWTEKT